MYDSSLISRIIGFLVLRCPIHTNGITGNVSCPDSHTLLHLTYPSCDQRNGGSSTDATGWEGLSDPSTPIRTAIGLGLLLPDATSAKELHLHVLTSPYPSMLSPMGAVLYLVSSRQKCLPPLSLPPLIGVLHRITCSLTNLEDKFHQHQMSGCAP